MKSFLLSFAAMAIAMFSCSREEPGPMAVTNLPEPVEQPVPPPNSMPISSGAFTSFAHSLSGSAVFVADNATDMRSLRLENFSMAAGPDVYVMLSKTNNYSAANTISLGMLKGSYSNNNLSLPINGNVDLDTHRFVLIYCVEFHSLFGFAEPE